MNNKEVKITKKDIISFIRRRVEYGKKYRLKDKESLRSGWSRVESGECCEKCAMKDEHFDGHADALKAIVGCRNPFQLKEVCECHLLFRKFAEKVIQSYLKDLLWYLEVRPDLLKDLKPVHNSPPSR